MTDGANRTNLREFLAHNTEPFSPIEIPNNGMALVLETKMSSSL